MSDQLTLWDAGPNYPENGAGRQNNRERLAREMRYLLSISTHASRKGSISPAGVSYSLGVCLIEDWEMARGKGNGSGKAQSAQMPRFVDIKLTAEHRQAFVDWYSPGADQVRVILDFADQGYRVGVTWSGEHQSYTVSATCRNPDDVNNGLCMTAFSSDLPKAIALLWFKHKHVADCDWAGYAGAPEEAFG